MTTEIYRKYLDIINENSQLADERIQLDEGMMDMLKPIASKVIKMLGVDTMREIATKVKEITGGDYSLTSANAMKVAQGLGFTKEQASQLANKNAPVAEGLAGNWQGKLLQALHASALAGGALAPYFSQMVGGYDAAYVGKLLVMIGFIALMATGTFWSSSKGMVGAMGKHGNKGFETDKGPED